jgi:hypothetical protein
MKFVEDSLIAEKQGSSFTVYVTVSICGLTGCDTDDLEKYSSDINSEDRGKMFLRNVGIRQKHYTVSEPRTLDNHQQANLK